MEQKFALAPHFEDTCGGSGSGAGGVEEKQRLSGTIGVPNNIVSKLDRLMAGIAQRKEDKGKREREQQEGIRKTLADLGAKLDTLMEHILQQHEIKA